MPLCLSLVPHTRCFTSFLCMKSQYHFTFHEAYYRYQKSFAESEPKRLSVNKPFPFSFRPHRFLLSTWTFHSVHHCTCFQYFAIGDMVNDCHESQHSSCSVVFWKGKKANKKGKNKVSLLFSSISMFWNDLKGTEKKIRVRR